MSTSPIGWTSPLSALPLTLSQAGFDEGLRRSRSGSLADIDRGSDLTVLLAAEAQAAGAYWRAWSDRPVPFPSRSTGTLPGHWLTFGQRASLLTGGPRRATNSANAILNYLYALLEAETTLACHAVGLDPALGIFHTDQRERASMALDAMEAVRPAVDAYVLALLTQRTLSPKDFVETRQGACRMTQRYAATLAETCTAWRDEIAALGGVADGGLLHTRRSTSDPRSPLRSFGLATKSGAHRAASVRTR